ncbi:Kiwa anti-phage protein KwaB-like domain-containing protein [Aquitalea magnusonii]|uniref:Uncharacterized protein DUF4868 n=1 Tax=Aquitalea magnusonii TaxID=332411 RepID=A0A318JMH0_9NEIS|nr:Kiwa anti-phage protein KwaB-like domain-containing protein [Aquitalea magnusonii]PXX51121.1 uncharacterized protein DUF4868 [Aquitalea magnusonii]
MNFNSQNITLVTLYGFFEDAQSQNPRHIQIPVAVQVQNELKTMLLETISRLGLPASAGAMKTFDPAEKYSSEEQLKIALNTAYLRDLDSVISLSNLPSDVHALDAIADLEYYYAIFTDNQNRKLYAFRRASQFKGITKSKLTWIDGGLLKMMTSSIFRLDIDFDYIVLDQDVFILRPSGFEFTANIGEQILQAAAANAQNISSAITYLDMTSISTYATTHKRSARLLAAIKSRNDLHLVDRNLLVQACQSYGVQILNPEQGQLTPDTGYEYDFLCILDRRAYTALLIPNQSEKYEAASRVQK